MISIAIPLYNKAASIASTIAAIQAQTYGDFEIIVVDGWSTDGSTEIIRNLAQKDSRIRVLMQENRHGVTPARNESVRASRGGIIAFIDADDLWKPEYLETLVRLAEDFPEAGIWGLDYGSVCGEKSVPRCAKGLPDGFRGIIRDPWKTCGCPYWTGATAVSKKAFEAVGGFDNNIIYGEDIDLWYRIMLKFPAAFHKTEDIFSFYRLDAENRACEHTFPLKLHLPYHIGKYREARKADADFRRFFDRQCLYRLFPYAGRPEYREELKQALSEIDFSLQKASMRLRFIFPRLYRLHQRFQNRPDPQYGVYDGGSKDRII